LLVDDAVQLTAAAYQKEEDCQKPAVAAAKENATVATRASESGG